MNDGVNPTATRTRARQARKGYSLQSRPQRAPRKADCGDTVCPTGHPLGAGLLYREARVSGCRCEERCPKVHLVNLTASTRASWGRAHSKAHRWLPWVSMHIRGRHVARIPVVANSHDSQPSSGRALSIQNGWFRNHVSRVPSEPRLWHPQYRRVRPAHDGTVRSVASSRRQESSFRAAWRQARSRFPGES